MMGSWLRNRSPVSALRMDGTDSDFDAVYPRSIRQIAGQHFTPLAVAKKAARFLVTRPGIKVLDIGSGAGKFCFVGASVTQGNFTGIEQRESLVILSRRIAQQCDFANVQFIHGNIMAIDIKEYEAFYFFNPFFENVNPGKQIDDDVLLSPSLFKSYSSYLSGQLRGLPDGSRLATYYSPYLSLREEFQLLETSEDGHLHLWEKQVRI